jgi:hypothetical protein
MAEVPALLAEAARVWAKAQIVYDTASLEGYPPARALVEQVACVPECHDWLLALLSAPNQLVVAYALRALELMGSPALPELPDELLERGQQVTFQCGSFRNSMDLGGLARQIRKIARAAAGRGSAPDLTIGKLPHDRGPPHTLGG